MVLDSSVLRNPGSGIASDSKVDWREQLYNQCNSGPIHEVQLPLESITSLAGIMIDLDPGLLQAGNGYFEPSDSPEQFFTNVIPVLQRHPLARKAEIRSSGRGLHVLIRLDPAVQLCSTFEQMKWDHIYRVIQRTLPGDPAAPGITALTRPVGSINSTSGREVCVLSSGEPIRPEEVLTFIEQLRIDPVRTLLEIFFGTNQLNPCPICRTAHSRLSALDRRLFCYGKCSKPQIKHIFDLFYINKVTSGKPSASTAKEVQ